MPRGLPVQRLPEEVERPLEAAVRGVGAGGEAGQRTSGTGPSQR